MLVSESWTVLSVSNPCQLFFAVFANRTLAMPTFKPKEIGLPATSLMVLGINEYGTFVGREALV